jgi:hypothetical protein
MGEKLQAPTSKHQRNSKLQTLHILDCIRCSGSRNRAPLREGWGGILGVKLAFKGSKIGFNWVQIGFFWLLIGFEMALIGFPLFQKMR